MSEQPESLVSAIRTKLDEGKELTVTERVTYEQGLAIEQKFEGWLVTLKRRFPLESEKKLRERAAELACMNRRERRRYFKHSSPKLPRFMKIPKGK